MLFKNCSLEVITFLNPCFLHLQHAWDNSDSPSRRFRCSVCVFMCSAHELCVNTSTLVCKWINSPHMVNMLGKQLKDNPDESRLFCE